MMILVKNRRVGEAAQITFHAHTSQATSAKEVLRLLRAILPALCVVQWFCSTTVGFAENSMPGLKVFLKVLDTLELQSCSACLPSWYSRLTTPHYTQYSRVKGITVIACFRVLANNSCTIINKNVYPPRRSQIVTG
jgi:hypothetical protein